MAISLREEGAPTVPHLGACPTSDPLTSRGEIGPLVARSHGYACNHRDVLGGSTLSVAARGVAAVELCRWTWADPWI
jgi:hypothetical protein